MFQALHDIRHCSFISSSRHTSALTDSLRPSAERRRRVLNSHWVLRPIFALSPLRLATSRHSANAETFTSTDMLKYFNATSLFIASSLSVGPFVLLRALSFSMWYSERYNDKIAYMCSSF